ncbi:zinc-dependent alcohol dehydrogenase [Herbiconiux liangxiaofengii]|uniref:zinc-dependent alcohol dehydrogenase n=1 Tax=Herbiconiux liangxiaofengii TaxID=3342795 RepID=UPI0035BA7AC9
MRISPGEVMAGTAPVPPELPGEVLVEVAYLGICGTDVDLLQSTSFFIEQGLSEYPLVFGHEWTGTVVAVAPGVVSLRPGDAVVGQTLITCGACGPCQAGDRSACLNHQEVGLLGHDGAAARYISMPATALTRLPEGASLRDATLIEPGVTAMNAVLTCGTRFDDRVAVIGTGALGLLALAVALRVSPSVDVIGVNPTGLALAAELGARRTLRPEEVGENDYTVVIEASGQADSVALLGRMLRPGGRAALVGVVNGSAPGFLPALITMKGITLHGIFHGLDHYGRMAELIATPGFPAEQLIDRVLPWHDAQEAFAALAERRRSRPKILLDLREMR